MIREADPARHYDDVMDRRELNAGLLKKVWNDFGLARRNEL